MNSDWTLHHTGFVVGSIAGSIDSFERSLSASWDGNIFEDPYQKVKVAFLTIRRGDPQVELIEPNGGDSPVLRFLEERGGGLHHLCYEVNRLDDELAAMKSRGVLIVRRPKPAVAFAQRRIAWVLTAEKLLLELLERETPTLPMVNS